MTGSDLHNQLAREWVMKVFRETQTASEAMVAVESALFGAMLLLTKVHGMQPHAAAEMVEMAVQQATDRFSQIGGDHAK